MTPRQPTTAQDGPNAPQTVDTMPGDELDLVAIEKRLEAATPGPWHYDRDYETIEGVERDGDHWLLDTADMDMTHIGYIAIQEADYPGDEANIDFVANAPADIAALVATVKAQQAEIKRLRGKIPPDTVCPFCHHPVHADLGCRFECSCKRHKKGKVGN